MADVKREVRALGAKISGLKAGDTVTLTFKNPKPRVDASDAKLAVQISDDAIAAARDALKDLKRAESLAASGKAGDARRILESARKVADRVAGDIPRAQEWVDAAGKEADSALAEVKDGQGAVKEAAATATGHLKGIADAVNKTIGAVGALIEETAGRE